MIVKKIGNIEIKLNDPNGDLFIKDGTDIVKVPSDDVDDFIQALIDEAWCNYGKQEHGSINKE